MAACTFIGHKNCSERIKPKVYENVERLILNHNVDVFYVGTHGDFDYLVYQTLCEIEKVYPIKIKVVLAYLSNSNAYYDLEKTIFPEGLECVPKKFAIYKRNEYMIEKSQYMICYVNNTITNASKFLDKATKKNLKVINLGKINNS